MDVHAWPADQPQECDRLGRAAGGPLPTYNVSFSPDSATLAGTYSTTSGLHGEILNLISDVVQSDELGNDDTPLTVTQGTNILVGHDRARILAEVERILRGEGKRGQIPALWDGHAAERIVAVLLEHAG